MKRLDLLLVSALVALAAFVGDAAGDVQLLVPAVVEGSIRTTGSLGGAVGTLARATGRRRGAGDDSEPRDLEEVQRRLRSGAPGTYINEILVRRDSSITRWPDRRAEPLRVWVQPTTRIAGFDPGSPAVVREAFTEWAETGVPLSFSFVLDSAAADIHVTWVDRFNEPISGKTLWAHDSDWWIVEANIELAVHHNGGDRLDSAAVRAIALHEIGHLIGLDHTMDASNIMTPKVRVRSLSEADERTARLLYMLPPGPVR